MVVIISSCLLLLKGEGVGVGGVVVQAKGNKRCMRSRGEEREVGVWAVTVCLGAIRDVHSLP